MPSQTLYPHAMKTLSAAFLSLALLSSGAHAATACFDDRYPADAANLAYPGMTVTGAYAGIQGGVGNGDPGGWGLAGTCGSAFIGVNSGVPSTTTFNFTPSATAFTVDVGVGYGASNTFTVTAFNGATQVGQQTFSITDIPSLGSGTWLTSPSISGVGSFTSVEVTATVGTSFAWGLDNVQYTLGTAPPVVPSTPASIPTLSEWGLILTSAMVGLFGFAWMRRRS